MKCKHECSMIMIDEKKKIRTNSQKIFWKQTHMYMNYEEPSFVLRIGKKIFFSIRHMRLKEQKDTTHYTESTVCSSSVRKLKG
ncbi:uncharacterized protein DS421_8g232250 [Arachis hypogaea]|nr:uncharacterized protein DS421_8g232250 [Arachis hypogaea]